MINQPYNSISTLSHIVWWWTTVQEKYDPKFKKWDEQLSQLILLMPCPKPKRGKDPKDQIPSLVEKFEPELKEWLQQTDGCPSGLEYCRESMLKRCLELAMTHTGSEWMDRIDHIHNATNAAYLKHRADFISPITEREQEIITRASRRWDERNPEQYATKSNKPINSGNKIDQVVDIIRKDFISREEIIKLTGNSNMLSITSQINARLKKLELKLKKKKKLGVTYYGVQNNV